MPDRPNPERDPGDPPHEHFRQRRGRQGHDGSCRLHARRDHRAARAASGQRDADPRTRADRHRDVLRRLRRDHDRGDAAAADSQMGAVADADRHADRVRRDRPADRRIPVSGARRKTRPREGDRVELGRDRHHEHRVRLRADLRGVRAAANPAGARARRRVAGRRDVHQRDHARTWPRPLRAAVRDRVPDRPARVDGARCMARAALRLGDHVLRRRAAADPVARAHPPRAGIATLARVARAARGSRACGRRVRRIGARRTAAGHAGGRVRRDGAPASEAQDERPVQRRVSQAHARGGDVVGDLRLHPVRAVDVAADDLQELLSRTAAARAEPRGDRFGDGRARVAGLRAAGRQARPQAGDRVVVRAVRAVAGARGHLSRVVGICGRGVLLAVARADGVGLHYRVRLYAGAVSDEHPRVGLRARQRVAEDRVVRRADDRAARDHRREPRAGVLPDRRRAADRGGDRAFRRDRDEGEGAGSARSVSVFRSGGWREPKGSGDVPRAFLFRGDPAGVCGAERTRDCWRTADVF
ncbi:conserved hypothetical protein [Burkholderia cenocepacia]|nr:conserved hypothetical protein [Burkholderia cenocepacia]